MRSLGLLVAFAAGMTAACGRSSSADKSTASSSAASPSATAPNSQEAAPPASQTGGFDGANAYAQTATLVSFGPRPPDSDALHQTQKYIQDQLKGYGCPVDTDDFHTGTPIGTVAMKNIIAKIPGEKPGILLLLTHYDTLKKPEFVGAVDGGSSSGMMLEMARLVCAQKNHLTIWIAFLDGEEAFVQWSDTDSTYGSRELAARMAMAGDLKQVKAVLLADMVGPINLQIKKDPNSTPWLTDLVWSTAARLGYGNYFVNDTLAIEDDHLPFTRRSVAAVDVIDLAGFQDAGFWHTPQDTMDKVSAKSLAIVGHVFLESVNELEKKYH
ncbi:MAG: M28 family peptidase [Candidatus Acidiferrales bacterium]